MKDADGICDLTWNEATGCGLNTSPITHECCSVCASGHPAEQGMVSCSKSRGDIHHSSYRCNDFKGCYTWEQNKKK